MLNSSPWLVGSFRGFLLWYYIVSVITVEMKIFHCGLTSQIYRYRYVMNEINAFDQ